MLINLSNHPSSSWSSEQKSTAEFLFGTILDMPFPEINPHWNDTEVKELANEYYKKITSLLVEGFDAVHIMGEQTFCYYLINKLKEAGIQCIASTTKRIVEEVDGKKISKFEFVRFRYY